MTNERDGDIRLTVATDDEAPTAAALSQLLSGVAIMREAIELSISGERSAFAARLANLRSPLLWSPDQLLDACGQAWAAMTDWPPMDPIIRGALVGGVLEACATADGPRVASITRGSVKLVIRDLLGIGKPKLVKGLQSSAKLIGHGQRAAFKNDMMSLLVGTTELARPEPQAGGFAGMPMADVTSRPMFPVGVVMFGCQQMEAAYRGLKASSVDVTIVGGSAGGGSSGTRGKTAKTRAA